jgi:alpha-glucosidase
MTNDERGRGAIPHPAFRVPHSVQSAIGQGRWWQSGVVYQIYPRSFQDSAGDGIGDLPGIASRLDYLQWLGVDAVWISPFYPSPMADFGYDVSDHTDVHPMFGTLEDFDRLVEQAHARGIRVILDYVPNHTSDRHPWFLASRSSREDPKRDWYIWKDPAPDGGVPNNWLSNFGGPAWTLDERTGQYYYHAYLREQPDLNWRNPEVREAMLGVLRFWLERGVDGFRLDALRQIGKDAQFRDNPPDPGWHPEQGPYRRLLPAYSADRPETLEYVAVMRRVADDYGDTLLIGELYVPLERLMDYYGTAEAPACHLPANFHLISTPWNARKVGALVDRYETTIPEHGWPNWVLGNHDKPRLASRVGDAQARVAAMLLLTLRGTPTLYYGDELGMRDVPIPPERVHDPWEKNVPGLGLGRDPERTPMQWDETPGAGFTTGEPWLPLADDHREVNVRRQREDPGSMLTLYRRLIELRRREPALSVGGYTRVQAQGELLTYLRTRGERRFLVVLNLGMEPAALEPVALPGGAELRGRIALSTHLDREDEALRGAVEVLGAEGVVVELF